MPVAPDPMTTTSASSVHVRGCASASAPLMPVSAAAPMPAAALLFRKSRRVTVTAFCFLAMAFVRKGKDARSRESRPAARAQRCRPADVYDMLPLGEFFARFSIACMNPAAYAGYVYAPPTMSAE